MPQAAPSKEAVAAQRIFDKLPAEPTEAAQQRAQREATVLARFTNISHEGARFVIPEDLTMREAIMVLIKRITEDEETISIHEVIDAYPNDGCLAVMKAMSRVYGWATPTTKIIETMFGDIKVPPVVVDIEVDHGVFEQGLFGQFSIPGIDGNIEIVPQWPNPKDPQARQTRPQLIIAGEVKQKHLHKVKKIADLARDIVRKESIYQGKALRLHTNTEDGTLVVNKEPGFLDTKNTREDELIFSKEVAEQVDTNVFAPIEHTAQCQVYGVPLKRGILLEGRYGVGKSLTAHVMAKKAVQNGWTFVLLDRVEALRDAVRFARFYGPAVVFAEDIDRVVSGDRDMSMDDILNVIDGIDSKGTPIITVLTTNFVEKIDKAMLRPGRLDAVISITPPDKEAVERLVRLYGRGLIETGEDVSEAAGAMENQIPAFIREVVERSKLYAIRRLKSGDQLTLKGTDLLAAAKGMQHHLDLLKEPDTQEPTVEQRVGDSLRDLVTEAVSE